MLQPKYYQVVLYIWNNYYDSHYFFVRLQEKLWDVLNHLAFLSITKFIAWCVLYSPEAISISTNIQFCTSFVSRNI